LQKIKKFFQKGLTSLGSGAKISKNE